MASLSSSNPATIELEPTWAAQSQVAGFSIAKLERLALPKGTDILCESSGEPARVKLVTPYTILYYASEKEAVLSWEGIMHKVCPLLEPLRSQAAITGTKEDREKRA